jgi:hypothetical protein
MYTEGKLVLKYTIKKIDKVKGKAIPLQAQQALRVPGG